MQVFHSLNEIAALPRQDTRKSVVTIGSFDGIHRAHAALLKRVSKLALSSAAASVAVSFEPHPLAVLAPGKMPKLLTPLPMKVELLKTTGIDRLLLLPFTRELSQWSPEQFVTEVLVNSLHARMVIVGENFRFGHRQAGTPELLLQLGRKHDFQAEVFPKMSYGGRTVSSSEIRSLMEAGIIAPANRLLGRRYAIRGPIESGLGIGSKHTVPTFNLGPYDGLIPATGVYITSTRLFDEHGDCLTTPAGEPSVTNIGTRPTFGERGLGVETHLLNPPAGAPDFGSPKEIEVAFLHRLRDEKKFHSASALLAQIQSDIARAHRYFERLSRRNLRHA